MSKNKEDKLKKSTKVMQWVLGGLLAVTFMMGVLSAFFGGGDISEMDSYETPDYEEQNPF